MDLHGRMEALVAFLIGLICAQVAEFVSLAWSAECLKRLHGKGRYGEEGSKIDC